MKEKLLIIILAILWTNGTFAQALPQDRPADMKTVNAIQVNDGRTISTHALVAVDSITHSATLMMIHQIENKTNHLIDSIVSVSYRLVNGRNLDCGFSGYNGNYGVMTDARDGEIYKTVKIGNQTWMAENLRYDVPHVYAHNEISIDTFNANYDCKSYGRLYDWNTMMAGEESSNRIPSGVQGICPHGWHIPSDGEWKQLLTTLGVNFGPLDKYGWKGTDQAMSLKAVSGWDELGNGSNSSGFNAYPAGFYINGKIRFHGRNFCIWTTSSGRINNAKNSYLSYTDKRVFFGDYVEVSGQSCRCIKD